METTPTYLFEFLEHRAHTAPDDLGYVFDDHHWSWSDAWKSVRKGAGALRAEGIGRHDTVAFVDKNTIATPLLTLSCALLGSTLAIPNWRLSADELEYTLNHSGATIVFVGHEVADNFMSIRENLTAVTKVVIVGGPNDEYEEWLQEGESIGLADGVQDTDTCILLYSSGTTGRPKGIKLTQRNMVQHTVNNASQIKSSDPGMMIVGSPMFHVGGTSTSLVNPALGLASYIIRDVSLESLSAGIRAGATHAFMVPAVVASLIQAGPQQLELFKALDVFLYGAAPMPKPVLDAAMEAWPKTEFMHAFGMTELGGVVTYLDHTAHRDKNHPERLLSVGKPIPGVEVRVVNPETLIDVPAGSSGELWFRTDQATPGYLDDPVATKELITDDGWVRTGDIGRMDDEGFIFVLDRLKDMIITGGENVYSPEVERVLETHPAVREVAVIGVPDEKWGETVKAVVSLDPDDPVDEDELIAYTRRYLAGFKAPTSVDIVDALPRNPAGKILKRSLRQPYWSKLNVQI